MPAVDPELVERIKHDKARSRSEMLKRCDRPRFPFVVRLIASKYILRNKGEAALVIVEAVPHQPQVAPLLRDR